ncbi:MAG TPA: hypothetical protein VHX39_08845, partial [Acetobacteraceae bacterium]|nr:hypothetical protein [Acetobacteraceae bacterium]
PGAAEAATLSSTESGARGAYYLMLRRLHLAHRVLSEAAATMCALCLHFFVSFMFICRIM